MERWKLILIWHVKHKNIVGLSFCGALPIPSVCSFPLSPQCSCQGDRVGVWGLAPPTCPALLPGIGVGAQELPPFPWQECWVGGAGQALVPWCRSPAGAPGVRSEASPSPRSLSGVLGGRSGSGHGGAHFSRPPQLAPFAQWLIATSNLSSV